MIDIEGDWQGDIFAGKNNKKGEEKIPDGLFVRGKASPRKKSGGGESDSKNKDDETGELKDNENFVGREKEKDIETSAKKVGLINNEQCEFTLHNPDEVGVSGCERCEITIYEPKKLVVDGCERCTFIIYTSDPEQINFNGGTNNDDRTTFTYLDPEDDSEWDWPPEDENDGKGELETDAQDGQISVGGESSGSTFVSGDNQTINTAELGEELSIGSEVLLTDNIGSVVRNESHNDINLTGVWELQYDDKTDEPLKRRDLDGIVKFVYKRYK